MRLAVIADIHANLIALEAVLEDICRHNVDSIICAGDLINAGPQPEETLKLLKSACKWIICGNNDRYVTDYHKGVHPDWNGSRQFSSATWTYRCLDQEMLAYLNSLPEECVIELPGTHSIRVVHGAPGNISKSIYPGSRDEKTKHSVRQLAESLLICAHTHVPWNEPEGKKHILNPGAVSGPINGDIGAQYALLNWDRDAWRITHRTIPYDIKSVRKVFHESGYLTEGGAFALAILLSIETGKNIAADFVRYAFQTAENSGLKGCKTIPNEIWDEAVKTWNWSV